MSSNPAAALRSLNSPRWTPGSLLGLLVLVAGCGQAPPPAQAPAAEPAPSEEVLVRVDQQPISASQVAAFARLRGHQTLSDDVRQWALSELINLHLLAAEAEASGLVDARVEAEIEVQRLSLVAAKALAAVGRDQPIGDGELQAEYQRQVGVTGRREYRLQHILVPDQSQADGIIARLAAGEGFADLVADYAEQIGAANAGDLGWVNLAQVPAAFADPLKTLSPGNYTATPIRSEYGWHVVFLNDQRDFEPPAFEAVKDGIRNTLARQKLEQHLAELRARATISGG